MDYPNSMCILVTILILWFKRPHKQLFLIIVTWGFSLLPVHLCPLGRGSVVYNATMLSEEFYKRINNEASRIFWSENANPYQEYVANSKRTHVCPLHDRNSIITCICCQVAPWPTRKEYHISFTGRNSQIICDLGKNKWLNTCLANITFTTTTYYMLSLSKHWDSWEKDWSIFLGMTTLSSK